MREIVHFTRRAIAAVVIGAATLAAPLAGAAPGNPDRYHAVVQRTSYGIPHVKANDYGGLGYGYGYAFAQDNLCVLADRIVTVSARRSYYFGEGTNQANLNSDFFQKYVQDEGKLRAFFGSLPADIQALVTGYAAGYNRYLRETGVANLPAACRDAAWVRTIDALDLMRVYYSLTLRASSENQLTNIVYAQPPAIVAAASDAVREAVDVAAIDLSTFERPETLAIGSNAVALGRDATESGTGLLLGNPHFPWQGAERFYEVHLTIPGEFDVMGASLFGIPVVNIGFTKDVAWSHTVSTAYRFTPYLLVLVPGNPTAYFYDGQVRQMTKQTVSVDARQPDGSIVARSHDFYRSHLGPMLENPNPASGLPFVWTTTVAFTMRDANADNGRFLEQFLRFNRAGSVDDIRKALGEVVGLPWVNTIAADRWGNAFYGDVSVVPNVSAAKIAQCVNSPIGQAVFQAVGLPILDGTTSACEWGIDPDAPQPGIFSMANLPHLTRSDYATNSNDSYWLANPEQPLTGFSPIIGRENTARSLRTRLGLRLVQDRLSGTDGLAGDLFSLENLQTVTFNNRNYGAEQTVTDLVGACGDSVTLANGSVVDLRQAKSVLAGWDRKANLDSVGAHLFREFWNRGSGTANFWAVPFSVNDPVNTPNTLNVGNPTVLLNLCRALGGAVGALAANGIPLDRPWGDVQYVVRNGVKHPIHGGAHSEGIFNVITSVGLSPAGYAEVVHGTSYIQTVTFDRRGPVAHALLTYSQSTNPASPWYVDQTIRYTSKQWVKLPFQQGEIGSDPNFTNRAINE